MIWSCEDICIGLYRMPSAICNVGGNAPEYMRVLR